MAILALNDYLRSVLKTTQSAQNELCLPAGSSSFDFFTVYLENDNRGVHSYTLASATIFFVVSGLADVTIGQEKLRLKSGNLLLANAGLSLQLSLHRDVILAKLKFPVSFQYDLAWRQLTLSQQDEQTMLAALKTNLENQNNVILKSSPSMKPAQLMQQLLDEYLSQDLFTQALAKTFLTEMLIYALRAQRFRQFASQEKVPFANSRLDDFIAAHYTDISLKEAANYFGLNVNYFSGLVKAKTGKTFVAHVDEQRMIEARRLLAQPEMSLKEIIHRVGYSSKSFFYKKFGQYYGITPAAMRAELFAQANINLG